MRKLILVDDFSARTYQQSIFANSINRNTLVVLPTGLGKTIIALLLVVHIFNKNPNKKILFLAPTKPLIEQQINSFKSFFKNANDFTFQLLTGQIQPKKRIELYKNSDFIFSTPQLIENDLINKIISPKDFSLIIFDEAHRGTGNYAYTFIAQEFSNHNVRILALTASPASNMDSIKEIINNLRIENIEVKKYDDPDVKPFVNKTNINYVEVELSEKFKLIRDKLNLVYKNKLKELGDLGFLLGKNLNQISKTDLLKFQTELRNDISNSNTTDNTWKAISISAGLMKLSHGIELFETQDIFSAYNYFYEFFDSRKNKTKAIEDLLNDFNFRESFEMISELKKQGARHPKLLKLKEIVSEKILKNPNLKIIVFSQFRDTAIKIVEEFSNLKELKSALFVGQTKKDGVGLSQKKQKEMLDNFRRGDYNILVSTSVGEEGLDIPNVDLVIFYEPIPSAIRTIQRSGRTGRFNEGEVIVLITKNSRDVIMRHVARAKEKKMYQILDKIRNEFSNFSNDNLINKSRYKINTNKDNKKNDNSKDTNLNDYINNDFNRNDLNNNDLNNGSNNYDSNNCNSNNINNTNLNNMNIRNNSNSNFEKNEDLKFGLNLDSNLKPLIYVDSRENSLLIKELFKYDELEVKSKKLNVGDIVISEKIAIERKSKLDFVNSILDGRIFPQLKNLAINFQRPILILEGSENIYTIRNLNENVIRGTLSSIAIDYRIPIIYTNSMEETAKMILIITKRNYKNKKDISLNSIKYSHSINEDIEKVISSIPKINIITAKNLMNHFNSIKNLVNASEEEIMRCEGVGKIRSKSLFEFFRKNYNLK